jgi:hypothetical protein
MIRLNHIMQTQHRCIVRQFLRICLLYLSHCNRLTRKVEECEVSEESKEVSTLYNIIEQLEENMHKLEAHSASQDKVIKSLITTIEKHGLTPPEDDVFVM